MSLIKSLLFTLLLAAAAVQASTRDEIERLWNPQGMAAQPAQPAAGTSARTEKPAPRWFRLSNGRQVNLADWKVVLFMQGHCPYCHQFDPVLKQLAQQYGTSVFPYTLDGQGDTSFPEALPLPPDVMQTFFPNIPVATPTTFLVNVNTLEALPLLQGAADAAGFITLLSFYSLYHFFFGVRLAHPSSLKSGSASLKSLLPWKNCFQSSFLPRALV